MNNSALASTFDELFLANFSSTILTEPSHGDLNYAAPIVISWNMIAGPNRNQKENVLGEFFHQRLPEQIEARPKEKELVA